MREDETIEDAQRDSRLGLTRRHFLQRGGVAAIGLKVLGSLDSSDAYAEPTGSDVSSALAQTAQDAVIFGVPVLLQSRYLKRVLKAGLTFNRFALDVDLSTPTTKALGPNDDTLYGLAWFDLTNGPQVIVVPPSHGRYYCIQLVDMWSNSFAYIGSRATGEQGGAFALTPPGWNGRLPSGVREIKAPTKRILSFPRTFVRDVNDLEAARSFQASWTTGALAQYPHDRIDPDQTHDLKPLDAFTTIDLSGSGISIYEEMNALIHEYPPLAEDASHARLLRPIGLDVLHYRNPDPRLAQVLEQAIKPALNAIMAEQQANVSIVNGWATDRHVKAIEHDPLKRAANTIFAPGAHLPQEALYFTLLYPSGSPPSGANAYTLHFSKGQLPPVDAFWSVILYDAKTLALVANSIGRYEISSHTSHLLYGPDGSLTIAIQQARPTATSVNWLPAPSGEFKLILRTYLPKPSVVEGVWKPPALIRMS